jgi:hypothetical protein
MRSMPHYLGEGRDGPLHSYSPSPPQFDLAKAGVLVRDLQALDQKLRITRLELHPTLASTDIPKPPLGPPTYVGGAEDVYHLVKHLPRPDLILPVYLDAYTSALQARPFINADNAPFSAVHLLLPRLDDFCATNLTSFYQAAEANVQPFPFLRLPTELRLRVYDYLIPNIAYVSLTPYTHLLLDSPPRQRNRSPCHDLALLHICPQIYDDFIKHVYLNRTLFLTLAHDPNARSLSDRHFAYRYEALLSLRPSIRTLFTHIEIEVGYLHRLLVHERRYHDIQTPSHPTDDAALRAFFSLLPNLESILLSFPISILLLFPKERPYFMAQREETLAWLRRCIPGHVRLRWDTTMYDPFEWLPDGLQRLGPIEHGASATSWKNDEDRYDFDRQVTERLSSIELARRRNQHVLTCTAPDCSHHRRATFPIHPIYRTDPEPRATYRPL